MKFHKIALTAAAAACLALAGCGDDSSKSDSKNAQAGAASHEPVKVAWVYPSPRADEGWSKQHEEARELIEKKYGDKIKTQVVDNVTNTVDAERVIRDLASQGNKLIFATSFTYMNPGLKVAREFPDVKFIALDVAAGDLLETAVAKAGESYDYTPENWDLSKYVDMSNVYCAVYQEELCGYMAGYAAVKLGYKNLGFLGGMAVPAVVRYGYGFVQGVDAAAADLGLTDVSLNYVYGGQFFGDADITAVMDTWYAGGTEVVFACGGGIYTSAVDAAKKANAKVIGVDVDQAGVIAGYAGVEGMTVTSAMKGLYPTTYDTLTDVIVNGNWDAYKGKIATLGLVSGDDPELNYVQIPMGEGTQWSDSFTQDDYKAMVKDMFDGKITVSNDVSKTPSDFATVIAVEDQGAIKG